MIFDIHTKITIYIRRCYNFNLVTIHYTIIVNSHVIFEMRVILSIIMDIVKRDDACNMRSRKRIEFGEL